ncbi:hypothetical protein [Oceanobacillus chungangensis]|uniref:hypothetical protein n=1 Tax=Oceanobacillus chungangensis TaxID=1229152 RepID=UPI0014745ECF|nr:hypothetical protein [Oceanobacillus chungangensis]
MQGPLISLTVRLIVTYQIEVIIYSSISNRLIKNGGFFMKKFNVFAIVSGGISGLAASIYVLGPFTL